MDALKKITEGMTGQESAQIIYQNDVNSLTDYIVSYLHPTEGENGTNVYTLNTAVAKIPQDVRKEGMTCTFLSEEGWGSYKYIGVTIDDEDWNVTDNWVAVVTEKELSNINEEVENLQRGMANAFTQNGFIWTFAGTKVEIVFKEDGNTSIAFPEQTVISYGNTSVICDMGISMIEVPAATKNLYLVFNISKGKVEVVTAQNQMNGTVLLGWISSEVKTAFLKCSDYTVNGKSMNPANYLLASDIVDGLISTSVDKPLSANMGRILSTQNGMMQVLGRDRTVSIDFSDSDQSVTISLPSTLLLSYGNARIIDSATSNGQVITDPMTDNRYKYLIYNLSTSQYELVLQAGQMNNSVLVGWINQYTKTAVLRCDNYTVDGVSRSFRNYIPKSNIAHDLTTTDTNKVLGADQAGVLATQNGMMHIYTGSSFISVNFSKTDASVTISLPRNLLLSYGNTRVGNSATDAGQEIIDPMTDDKLKYLIYDISEKQYKLVRYSHQMSGVLVGWVSTYLKDAILKCNKYSVDGKMIDNNSLSDISYANIPTTVIQLKKYADDGYALLQLISSIDTEVKITGGYVSYNTENFTETSIGIKKETSTNLYFKCIEPYAIIEAKGVYSITIGSNLTYNYISQNIKDFGNSLTYLSSSYNNNIYGEIKDFNRYMTYISIGEGTISKPNISGEFKDLPRLLTYLQLRSNTISISGDIVDLPRKLTYLYINAHQADNIIGNIVDLPRSLERIQIYGLTNKFTGNVVDLPRPVIVLVLSGTNYDISGNVKDMPSNLQTLQISGSSTIQGDISDLPKGLKYIMLWGNCNLKGSLADLPTGTIEISVQSMDAANPIIGDISDIPYKNVTLFRLRQNFNITFNGEFPLSDQLYSFELRPSETFPIDSVTVDNILIKLAAIVGERTGTRTISLLGACAAPTEASQAAIASLQQKGFTIQTN